MSQRTQRSIHSGLGLALLVSLAAAWFAPPDPHEDVLLSEHAQRANRVAGNSQILSNKVNEASKKKLLPIEVFDIHPREPMGQEQEPQLFASTQWGRGTPIKKVSITPKAVMMPPIDSPPPQAPPLPFIFLGRYESAGETLIFLKHLEQNLVVRAGDTIAEYYKVESFKGTTLTLRYLPLNQVQTLEVGGVQ